MTGGFAETFTAYQRKEQCRQARSDGRQSLFYSFPLIHRMGHLTGDMFYLRNIFSDVEYDFHVFVDPRYETIAANRAAFEIVTRGVHLVPTSDERILMAAYQGGSAVGLLHQPAGLYVLYDGMQVMGEFTRKHFRETPKFHYQLKETEMDRGAAVRRGLGIPLDTPVVTVCVRDNGFLPCASYHSYRDANIEQYAGAIQFLLDTGFAVVRLGDKGSRALHGMKGLFFDAPFHRDYEPFWDVYFLGCSEFFLGMWSGPVSLALGFGTRLLMTNSHLASIEWAAPGDLFIPKNYYSEKLCRFLTYDEIMTSPAVDYTYADSFAKSGIRLIENSPREITAAVEEMVLRLHGSYGFEEERAQLDAKVRKVQSRADSLRKQPGSRYPDFCGPYYSGMELCHSYASIHPWYLGADWYDPPGVGV